MYIKLIDREITASRFPWQKRTSVGILDANNKVGDKYGWKPSGGMGRFGGGWEYELGFHFGGSTLMIQCLVGSISVSKPSRCLGCGKPMLRGQPRGKAEKIGEDAWKYHTDCWVVEQQALKALETEFAPGLFKYPVKMRVLTDDELNDIPF